MSRYTLRLNDNQRRVAEAAMLLWNSCQNSKWEAVLAPFKRSSSYSAAVRELQNISWMLLIKRSDEHNVSTWENMTPVQAALMMDALDAYACSYSGQFNLIVEMWRMRGVYITTGNNHLLAPAMQKVASLATGLPLGSYYALGSEAVHEDARIAHDMSLVLRNRLALDGVIPPANSTEKSVWYGKEPTPKLLIVDN